MSTWPRQSFIFKTLEGELKIELDLLRGTGQLQMLVQQTMATFKAFSKKEQNHPEQWYGDNQ